MAKSVSSQRYIQFVALVAGSLAAVYLVTAIVCMFRAADGPEVHAWERQQVTNDFYRQIAGEIPVKPTDKYDKTPLLASDLRAWTVDTPRDQLGERLAAFTSNGEEGETSPYCSSYPAAALDGVLVGSCDSVQKLSPVFISKAQLALEGKTETLVSDNPRPAKMDRGFWFSGKTMAIIGLLAGLVGFVIASLVDHDERSATSGMFSGEPKMNWALNGDGTGSKLLGSLLAPHLIGVAVAWSTIRQARLRVPFRPKAPVTPLSEAEALLMALEAIRPRSAAVEESTSRARQAVRDLSQSSGVEAAEREARLLAERAVTVRDEVRVQEDARSELRRLR